MNTMRPTATAKKKQFWVVAQVVAQVVAYQRKTQQKARCKFVIGELRLTGAKPLPARSIIIGYGG